MATAPDPLLSNPAPPPRPRRRRRKSKQTRKPRVAPLAQPSSESLSQPESPAALAEASTPSISSEQAAAQYEAATAAVPDVIGEPATLPAGAAQPGQIPDTGAPAAQLDQTQEDLRRRCLAITEQYVPKIFEIAAKWRQQEHWKLGPIEKEILVPEIAGALEEIWPFLPDLFKNTEFPKLYGAITALGVVLAFKIAEDRLVQKRLQSAGKVEPKPVPGGTVPGTSMPVSAASSVSLASPDAEKVSAPTKSFGEALGWSSTTR